MTKESRISLRITDDLSRKIDRYVSEGRFASRSDFGTIAINHLLSILESDDNDTTVLFDVVSHLLVHTKMPVHTVPQELEKKFKAALAKRRVW